MKKEILYLLMISLYGRRILKKEKDRKDNKTKTE